MATYQHNALTDASPERQLFNLQPGHGEDPIHFTLTHALLNGRSLMMPCHTPGGLSITLPIDIDGCPFQATVNLESALRHLTLPAEPRVI